MHIYLLIIFLDSFITVYYGRKNTKQELPSPTDKNFEGSWS